VYTASNKNNTNDRNTHYTYHGIKGIVLRSKTENNNSFLDIIERKGVKNVGELRTNNISSFYRGRHIVRDGDRAQRFYRSGGPFLEYYHQHKADLDTKTFINCSWTGIS